MSKLILVIEADLLLSELYQDILSEAGYEVQIMASKPTNVQIIGQM